MTKQKNIDKDLLKKVREFIEMVGDCKVIRTPWFIIWIKWRSSE